MINPSEYVVIDLETNGLSSAVDDLLSISLFLPDTGKKYERFLPLELNKEINKEASKINGITKKMLLNKNPLTNEEYQSVKEEFELEKRTILHFGRLDVSFIKAYFKRHNIKGIEKLNFYNIKHNFITKNFLWLNNWSKDHLCEIFNIPGVTSVHTGINDCILEWKLFEVTQGSFVVAKRMDPTKEYDVINFYRILPGYYVPVSELASYANYKYMLSLPKIEIKYEEVAYLDFKSDDEFMYVNNRCAGISVEEIIRESLNAVRQKDSFIDSDNFKHLEYITSVKSKRIGYNMPLLSSNPKYENMTVGEYSVEHAKEYAKSIKDKIAPMINYIKTSVFNSKQIYTQEAIKREDLGIIGHADFSNEDACLELKYSDLYLEDYYADKNHERISRNKYQFYVVSNNRPMYLLIGGMGKFILVKLSFIINSSHQNALESVKKINKPINLAPQNAVNKKVLASSTNIQNHSNNKEKSISIDSKYSLTADQVALMINRSKSVVYNLIRNKKLEAIKIKNKYYISKASVEQYKKEVKKLLIFALSFAAVIFIISIIILIVVNN